MRNAMLLLPLLFLVGCGSDPAPVAPSPPPPASVAGNWTGTIQYTQATGGARVDVFGMNLTQAGSAVNGTYTSSLFNGTVSGATTTTTFSGTFTINAVTTTGTPCSGTMAVSGGAGGNTLTWTSPGITANCGNLPTGITIAVQLR